MNYWLIPANRKMYNYSEAFKNFGIIDWRDGNRRFNIGDIVYIYTTAPTSKLEFKCLVTKIKISFEDKIDDAEFWTNKYIEPSSSRTYVRLKLLKQFNTNRLSLEKLLNNGLKQAPQSSMRIRNSLLTYITEVDSNVLVDVDKEAYFEGNLTLVLTNKYERNPKARQDCLDYYGYDCQVCGMNFEKTYGILGKDFIHVHHIVPIYTINQEYIVDPIKDLVPICPNCHAMIHKKNNINEYYSINELKKLYNYRINND